MNSNPTIENDRFTRLPPFKERCPITGMTRNVLVKHIERGDIRGVHLREPGSRRGTWHFSVNSALQFLNEQADKMAARPQVKREVAHV